ncbi:MAG: polysaccharide deacetylase family protein [Xanthobacteraceae bacterium]|nr:polysaccharide deacetylase family protein [Xanthobacteraceae bacterium]
MRKFPVLVAAAAVAAVSVIGVTAKYYLNSSAVQTAANAKPELTTGSIETRWPKPGVERQAAAGEPAPQVAAPQARSQQAAASGAASPPPADRRAAAPKPACDNPQALGVSRTVQIDTTGGPGFGMSQYRDYDFLQPGEVVLTFDDGPWPVTTPMVLAALKAECLQATFFNIGEHAIWHPSVLKQVIAAGHTVGTHTWSHKNLAHLPFEQAKEQIEKGISAVTMMAGTPVAPFFRYPQLRQTAELKAYLAERNIAAFSIDIDSQDFKVKNPDQLVTSIMTQLKKKQKGIILMHDLHKWSATAVPALLAQLKANGYKVVHLRPKEMLATLPEYDAMIAAAVQPVKSSNARAMSSVVQTVD